RNAHDEPKMEWHFHHRPNRRAFGCPFESSEVGHCGGVLMMKSLKESDCARALTRPGGQARRGVSLLDGERALVAVGGLLSGFVPISALYIRQLRHAQQRLDPQTVYYLVPPSDFWSRKLGVAASVATTDPGTSSLSDPLPTTNTVLLESLQKS